MRSRSKRRVGLNVSSANKEENGKTGKKDSESENKLEEQAKSKRNLKKRPESIELDCDEDKCGKESQNTSKKTRSRINNLTNKVNRNSKALEKKADSENETTVNRNKKKQSKRKVTLFKNNSSKKVKHDEKCEKVKTSEDANSSGKEVVAVMQESSDTETESVEYEVEKLVDVYFKKKGQREFLVRWKGYSSKEDTWEPEKNLNCKILIENFLKKCEQAKQIPPREMRAERKQTDWYSVNEKVRGRNLRSRLQHGCRKTYYGEE